jgi:DNA-binding transcriptional ArsR family regulator
MTSHLIAHEPPDLLKLLAHELRWKLVQQLVHSDLRVQELAERVARPLNLVSYHLAQLRRGALVIERRSSSDARDVYYSLDLRRLQRLYHDAGVALHPALIECKEQRKEDQAAAVAPARRSPVRVLFLCTHNSARSQMAEAMLRRLGGDAVEVYSAGSEIREVHPLAIETMAERGIDIRGAKSVRFSLGSRSRCTGASPILQRWRRRCKDRRFWT